MKDKFDKFLVLFSCCFVTNGFNRSIIIDTQRNTFHFIPLVLGEFIAEFSTKTVRQIIEQFVRNDERQIFIEYLMFLEEKELCFYTDNPTTFPKIDKNFISPNIISNAVLDFRKDIHYPIEDHLQELEDFGCEGIQIRIFENLTQPTFNRLIASFEKLSFRYVELLLNADAVYTRKYLHEILRTKPNLNKVTLYNSTKKDFFLLDKYQILELKTTVIESREQCGQIGPQYFNTSLNQVIESHGFNSCLNKKISIDEYGFIKNCPSMNQSFGNAIENSLKQAMEKKGFKDFWTINKDEIAICKDCEFRHICTDCRAYTRDPDNSFSKPLKCGYDPYSNIWQDWSMNSLRTGVSEEMPKINT